MTRPDDEFYFWYWLRDKIVPALLIALCLGVFGIYTQIVRLVDAHETTRSQLHEVKAEVAAMREAYVKRIELLELLKRVEQQLEIALLKAEKRGVKG
jgi:hypothetical protein